MGGYRTERVGNLIREKIGALIIEGRIKDPRVHPFLSITRVEVSRDLSWAEVYVSTFRPEGNLARGVQGLQSAAGFIQAHLGKEMKIRLTPRLRFKEDLSIKEGFDLVQKLEALAEEAGEAEDPEEAEAESQEPESDSPEPDNTES
ncbi:MAG: 30S ribosome-binding factor RbfA [Treponema sp.]|nr:30S ribosome-binding factor RbfA [Treponema sp.]